MDIQTANTVKDFILQNPEALFGLVLPVFIDIFNREVPKERETERFLVTLFVCFVTAVFFNLNEILINSWAGALASFGIIFTESQAVYKLYFKESVLRSKLIERMYASEEIETSVG